MTKLQLDLSPLLSGDNDPNIDHKRLKITQIAEGFSNKWSNRTDYLEDPQLLADALCEYENWLHSFGYGGDELYYFGLRITQDEANPRLKAKFQQSIDFAHNIEDKMRFFELFLSKIEKGRQSRFLNFVGLEPYKHYLEKLFTNARYVLSEKEEMIMSKKYVVAHHNWTTMVSGFLSKEERHGKNFNEIISLLDNPKKSVRDNAAKDFNDILEKHVESAEHELNSVLANKKIDDEIRGFTRPDQSRHISDDIDSGTVDSLIDVVASNFKLSHRYYKLKAKLMGKKKLAYHERSVAVPAIYSRRLNYNWKESVDFVHRVVSSLDPEFGDILSRFEKNKQIDVYPRKGKRGGAFCAHELLSQPTYILLNHDNKLRDVQTLAHELGHGINNELMRSRQNALNFGSPMATAEVASTFLEDFVLEDIRRNGDDKLKLSLLMMKLNDDVSAIFRQVACYRFEQDLHTSFRAKGYLSHEEIGKLFQKNMIDYMGPAVEQSHGSQNWWIYWSHIRTFFYVYSYASGLLISKSLQSSVKKDPAFIGKVKEFLSSGMSDSPLNIFLNTGIDISKKEFWEKGIGEIETALDEAESFL